MAMIRAPIDPVDMATCRQAIRTGSYSFHAASRLLPAAIRDSALALYAFCRAADDAVDEGGGDARAAVQNLAARLDAVYAGRPRNATADRAFAAVVAAHDLPRALPMALIEGFAWDAAGRSYDDFAALCDYGARVAASVGAMMAVLMGVRGADALARACDLGLAMQLTNIARDIGTDARLGRCYLPREWLDGVGLTAQDIQRAAQRPDLPPDPRIAALGQRLLDQADALYLRAEAGIPALPLRARPAIFAARHIYAGIGGAVARAPGAALHIRAHTHIGQKLGWLALALARSAATPLLPLPAQLYTAPHPSCAFLVQAAADPARPLGRIDAVLASLLALKTKDDRIPLGQRGGLA